jgi:hypothetical protein
MCSISVMLMPSRTSTPKCGAHRWYNALGSGLGDAVAGGDRNLQQPVTELLRELAQLVFPSGRT